jgi:ABC-type Mn2+/Zn2+ transport system permease subunit
MLIKCRERTQLLWEIKMSEPIIEIFKIPFMQHALITGLLIGIMCSYLGVYIVLRRIVFVGVSLAQISSSGFAIGVLIGIEPMIAMLALTIFCVLIFALNLQSKTIPQDSFLALGYVIASAATILLLTKHPQGDADLMSLLFGNILTITTGHIYLLSGLLIVLAFIYLLFQKEFLFIAFDAETAETLGYNPKVWNMIFYITIGVLISLSVRSAGILLIFGFLVIPPVIAILLFNRIRWLFIISVSIAIIVVPIGLYLSFTLDVPSGPALVALMAVFLGISFVIQQIKYFIKNKAI